MSFTCAKLNLLDITDNVEQNEAADLSTLFDVGGIVGTFTCVILFVDVTVTAPSDLF